MEKIKLTKEQLDQIQQTIDQTVAAYIQEIPQMVKSNLDRIIAQCLGFKRGYNGQWEVDHCNGRMSTVSDYVSQKARQTIAKVVDEIGKDFNPDEDIRKAIQREYKEQMSSYRFRKQIIAFVEAKIKNRLDQLTSLDKGLDLINMSPLTKKDAANPEIGKNQLDHILLEDLTVGEF